MEYCRIFTGVVLFGAAVVLSFIPAAADQWQINQQHIKDPSNPANVINVCHVQNSNAPPVELPSDASAPTSKIDGGLYDSELHACQGALVLKTHHDPKCPTFGQCTINCCLAQTPPVDLRSH